MSTMTSRGRRAPLATALTCLALWASLALVGCSGSAPANSAAVPTDAAKITGELNILGDRRLGRVRIGDVGPQGDAASPLRLTPVALDALANAGSTVTATVQGAGTARLDALLVMPEIARLEASGSTGAVVLLTSKSERRQLRTVAVSGGRLQVEGYDRNGVRTREAMRGGRVVVEPGGFTLVFVGA